MQTLDKPNKPQLLAGIEPATAANLAKLLLVHSNFRSEENDTRLIVTVQAFTGVYNIPNFESWSHRRNEYNRKTSDDNASQERLIGMFFQDFGTALIAWADQEAAARLVTLEREAAAAKKKKEKEQALRTKQKLRATAAGDNKQLKEIEDEELDDDDSEAE